MVDDALGFEIVFYAVCYLSHFLDDESFAIIKHNAAALTLQTGQSFDLVFMDPPYRKNLIQTALQNLIDKNYLAEGATIIIESEKNLILNSGLEVLDTRHQGQSTLHILRNNTAV